MRPNVLSAPAEEEFRYGYRLVKKVLPDGTTDFEQVPLTLEDVLHPEEGDFIVDNTVNERDARYTADVFSSRTIVPAFSFVAGDLRIDWGVPGIRCLGPDVAVFVGLREPLRPTGTLDVQDVGGRCELATEFVSPSTRANDVVRKMGYYHRIGVPLYVVVDQKVEGGPRTLHAYRRGPAAYEEVPHDAQGRVLLPVVGLLIAVRDGLTVLFDAVTGEEVEDFVGQKRAREKAAEELRLFKDETDREMTAQVDKARRAESALAAQAAARQRAEDEATDQRKEADKQRLEADKQRLAREAAEQRVRDLEELLRRASAPPPRP